MTDFFSYGGFQAAPGINTLRETIENVFYWNNWPSTQMYRGAIIDGASRDSGNTTTSVLRPGLLLGLVYSTGKFKQWDPTATDGTQYIAGILDNPGINVVDSASSNRDRWRSVLIKGALKPDRLLIPGNASFGITGNANEYLIREQLKQLGSIFYEEPLSTSMLSSGRFFAGHNMLQAVTADRTLTNYESGTLFTNRGATGAVVFTLPASPKKGVWYRFFVVADQSVTIASGTADTMIIFNDATADSIAFSTSSKKIGASLEVIFDGTGWLCAPTTFTDGTVAQTITTAT